MKKISNYILIGVLALTLFGCEKYLDVNTDPNNPKDVTLYNLFIIVQYWNKNNRN